MSSIREAWGESGPRGESPGPPARATCANRSPSRAKHTRTAAFLLTRSGILWSVPERTRVQLPAGAGEHFQVYLNGVPQQPGRDFRREGRELVFDRRPGEGGGGRLWGWLFPLPR